MPSTVGIVASGEDVLNDAVFWVDAGRSSVVSGALSNLGTGGSALNAVFGNSTGVDSFDPALLAHTGTNYLYLSTLGNDATTPSATPLNINSNIECAIRVALDDWTPAAAHTLVSKYNGTASTGGYEFQINPTGEMRSVWDNGVTVIGVLSNAIPSFVDGTAYWLKYTIQPNNGSGGANCDFYWATDQSAEPSTWTRLGTQVVTTTTINSIATSTAGLRVGSRNGTSNQCQGKFYRAIVRNGIGGTTVFDADLTTGITSGAQTTFTESSSNAATVTINRSTSGRKAVAVTRPILLFGTDDYLEVPDNDLLDFGASDSFTVVAVLRQWATPTSFGRLIDKKNGGGAALGWQLANNGTAIQPGLYIGDTTNQTAQAASTSTAGQLRVFGGQVDRSAQRIYGINNTLSAGVSTTSVGALTNTLPMRIGVNATTATNNQDFELVAAAVWRRALNANEIATIVARYT